MPVPEAVRKEFQAGLDQYITEWKAAITKHVREYDAEQEAKKFAHYERPGLAKAQKGKPIIATPLTQLTAAQRIAAKKLQNEILDGFTRTYRAIESEIAAGMAAGLSAEEIAGTASLEKLVEVAGRVQQLLEEFVIESAKRELVKVIEDPPERMFGLMNSDAIEYAHNRAAEMVGRKWVGGRLVSNPDAKWSITQTTRDGLHQMISAAYEEGQTPRQLKQVIEASYTFSKGRAKMIATTECLTPETLVDGAVIRAAFRRWYTGPVVEIRTRTGRKFSTTPNHPMLTKQGWLAACEISKGDDLVCDASGKQRPGDSRYPNEIAKPSKISEIFEAFAISVGSKRELGSELDFHGDGMDGDIDVVSGDRMLSVGTFSPIYESTVDKIFPESNFPRSGFCEFCKLLLPVDKERCFCTSAHLDSGVSQTTLDSIGIYSVSNAECAGSLAAKVAGTDLFDGQVSTQVARSKAGSIQRDLCVGLVSHDSASAEFVCDDVPSYAGLLGDLRTTKSIEIEVDEVISVDVSSFCGHVYNLETPYGYFTIDGAYTGNTAKASVAGTLSAWRRSGVVLYKASLLSADHDDLLNCECPANAEQGAIPLDEPFQDGSDGPPYHPSCFCSALAYTEEPDEEPEDDDVII